MAIGALDQGCAHEPVTAFGDVATMVGVVGLADPWRDAKVGCQLVSALEVGDGAIALAAAVIWWL